MRRLAQLCLAAILSASPVAAQDWCGASRLNATERTICDTPALQWRDVALNRLWDYNGGGAGLSESQSDWLARRNRCGRDIACIVEAYDDRILAFDALTARRGNLLRPWCDASRLNPTERTICETPELADFDAALSGLYGSLRARDEGQSRWLRQERDACGTDPVCIGRTYIERIRAFGRRIRADDATR